MVTHPEQSTNPRLAPESLAGFFAALQKSGATTINAARVLLDLGQQPGGLRASEVARELKVSAQTAQGVLSKLHSLRLVRRSVKARNTQWTISAAGSNLLSKHTNPTTR